MSKEIDVTKMKEIAPGVVQKNEKTYYIQCTVAKTWHYCNKARLDKLIAKQGTAKAIGANYISRDAKRAMTPVKSSTEKKYKKPKSERTPEEAHTPLSRPTTIYITKDESRTNPKLYNIFSDEGTKCISPCIFKQNKGYCNECGWFSVCRMRQRLWKDFSDQQPRTEELEAIPMTLASYARNKVSNKTT